jgi:glycosyltransferase involved in cell wall biosynthesis
VAERPPIRVLHAPAAVGGHPTGLARAERELGLDSVVVTLNEPPFGYHADRVLAPAGTSTAVREWRRWREVARARSFDVVHFNFGSSLAPAYHGDAARSRLFGAYARMLEQRDLRLLRGAIFVTFQGDDVRPSGDADDDARKARRAHRFGRVAHGIYALNPDLLDHLPPSAQFLPYASVDPREWAPVGVSRSSPLRIVHAPSDRVRKGTDVLLAAAERVDGIELELVEGRSRAEARAALERADVVVDQLVVGWYGGVAVEAMALAKPVVARIDRAALERVPAELAAELPIVHADERGVEDVLRELANSDKLADVGRRGRAFVERWHDPLRIAERVVADYERALGSIARS